MDYSCERNTFYITKMREHLKKLPPYCTQFIIGIEQITVPYTRYSYVIDLMVFYDFLVRENSICIGKNILDITLEDINKLTTIDIEHYISYVGLYYNQNDEKPVENSIRGKARKLSSLRSFFGYLYKKGFLSANPSQLVETPKFRKREIIRLEPNEVAIMLDQVESGEALTEKQKQYAKATCERDVAIITLFLGTGMRVSELVGLNINDLNLENLELIATRKGGKRDILYYNMEVCHSLENYLEIRNKIEAKEGHEEALFLSMQNKRISVRAIENLVKKYARSASPLKKITPHKLRSTFGTMLYQESGDIYMVAEALGHADVNTTKNFYAAHSEDKKRMAARYVKLRDDS